MDCPKCKYDLNGNQGNVCPECGVSFTVVSQAPQRLTNAALYSGMGFIALYCVLTIAWLWQDHQTWELVMLTGGAFDPQEMATSIRIKTHLEYLARVSLGVGLLLVTFAIYRLLRRVAIR